VENTDIVLVMNQSVCQGKYPPATFDSVGLLIVDECHHLAARYFQTSMRYFSADARLGLTATANRADGLGFALHYFLGPTVYRIRRGGPEVGSGSTKVRVVRYRGGTRKEIRTRGRPDFTRMVTRQVQDDERNAAIAQIVDALLREGRRVIVMSARRNHLESLRELIGEDRSCLYMGETSKKRKRARDEAAKTSPCLLSTYSMGEEGLDIPALDTLVMVTPKSSLACIQQAVGRILREHPGKKSPLVVDFQDTYSVFHGMARKRRGWYESRKFRVTVEEVGGKSD
jgi:superfamily II DNA or RNA helicase